MKTRHGTVDDIDSIVQLSHRVQEALTAAGSLQKIAPLLSSNVSVAVAGHQCFVLVNCSDVLVGCTLVARTTKEDLPSVNDLDLSAFSQPWSYLHSFMLERELQGKGIGLTFFAGVMRFLRPQGGTIFLDCWAGNDKLRKFYGRAGCKFVAILPENDYEVALFSHTLECDSSFNTG